MKPVKLKMQAFGPYVNPVELDFEKGLHGEKFFLIHGATGAGKTSILDAICYSLYNESSGGDRKRNDLCSEFVPFDNVTELEFIFSLGKKIFKVHRTFKRKFDKNNKNKIKVDSTAELFVDDEFKFGKVTEVNDYLKNCLGFNVEQFRQVVMLPQSQFTKFLKANNDERANILNMIFNADLYEKIEDGLKKKSDEAKNFLEKIDSQQKNFLNEAKEIGTVDGELDKNNLPDLIEKFSSDCELSKNNLDKLKLQADNAQNNLTAGKILNEQFKNFETAEKFFFTAKKDFEKIFADFQKSKIEYDKRKAEEPQRKILENKIDELKKIQAAVVEFQNKKSELEKAQLEEKISQEKISKLEILQKKAENRLEELKKQITDLEGTDVNFKIAEQNLKISQDKENRAAELEKLKKELVNSKKRLETAEKNFDDAQKEVERLKLLQKMCTAAFLAQSLSDGEPCPVCGSTSHPKLAFTEEIIPTDEEIEQKENILKRKEEEKKSSSSGFDSITERINLHTEEIKKLGEVLNLEEAEKKFLEAKKNSATLSDCKKRIVDGEKFLNDTKFDLEKARKIFEEKSKSAANLQGIVKTLQNQIPKEYLDAPPKIANDLRENLQTKKILDDAWKNAEENFHKFDRQKSNQEGKIKSAEIAKIDAAKKIEGKIKSDIDALKKIADESKNFYEEGIKNFSALENNLKRLQEISKKLEELDKDFQSAKKNYDIWSKLSAVANGTSANSKISFQRYYLNVMFQNVIREANERLYKMSSGRYQFQNMEDRTKFRQKKAGLDLEILDIYNGKTRPIETLSGGESFLASLSLALGLAAVVKNSAGGINLDTIFIDEGFGSLDSETLDFAINALTDLQENSGRLVGIISHVEELKQRIPARLEVTKNKFGSTAKFF